MLIVLSPEHKDHLKFLTQIDAEAVGEFCKLALEFIRSGVNNRVYAAAAKKLSVQTESIKHAVEAIMFLLIECSKLMITEMDFHDSFLTLGLSEEVNKALLNLYLENRTEIRRILDSMDIQLHAYKNLEWRLDVQVASRALRQQMEPIIVMKLDVEGQTPNSHLLQTDPTTLNHIVDELEAALKEMRASHYRRVTRGLRS